MKNLFKPTLLVMLMSLSPALTSNAFTSTPVATNNIEKPNVEATQKLINRLEEIKSMDVSSMNRKEKRELRHEVKSINNELKANNGGGLYISVGAAIIIILLLIILL